MSRVIPDDLPICTGSPQMTPLYVYGHPRWPPCMSMVIPDDLPICPGSPQMTPLYVHGHPRWPPSMSMVIPDDPPYMSRASPGLPQRFPGPPQGFPITFLGHPGTAKKIRRLLLLRLLLWFRHLRSCPWAAKNTYNPILHTKHIFRPMIPFDVTL